MGLQDIPPYVEAWVRQLLDSGTLAILRQAGDQQVEVRLIANRGKVRELPAIILNAGPQPLVGVADVATNGAGAVPRG